MPDTLDRLETVLADRYLLQRELGRGGMATVDLAEDLKHHRPVALEVLKPGLAAVLGAERLSPRQKTNEPNGGLPSGSPGAAKLAADSHPVEP